MIPQSHPFIKNFFDYRDELSGLGNSLRIVVENTRRRHLRRQDLPGDAAQINDRIFLIPGRGPRLDEVAVDAGNVRWTVVTEEGFERRPGDARRLRRLAGSRSRRCASTSRAPASAEPGDRSD
jgi:hypothetical protein